MPHKKPTKKELEENIKKAEEELDTPEPTPEKEEEPKPTPSEPTPEEEVEPTPSEPAPSPDYKKKFVESSREALTLHNKNRKITEALEKAETLPDPTDKEMIKEYVDWDMMSDTEKKLAIDNAKTKKALELLGDVTKESKNIDMWNDKVDVFTEDPKTLIDNPELEGKIDDFKIFALKRTRRNMDFEDLISAFLFDASKKVQPKKGKMFETGSGGPNKKEKPKSDKITISEATALMKNDYKKFADYVRKGKIDMSEAE